MQSTTDVTTKLLSRNSLLESYVIRKRSCVVWRGAIGKVPKQLAGRLPYGKHGFEWEGDRATCHSTLTAEVGRDDGARGGVGRVALSQGMGGSGVGVVVFFASKEIVFAQTFVKAKTISKVNILALTHIRCLGVIDRPVIRGI
jgi:hypothetical protein